MSLGSRNPHAVASAWHVNFMLESPGSLIFIPR